MATFCLSKPTMPARLVTDETAIEPLYQAHACLSNDATTFVQSRRHSWKAGTHIFTAWKQGPPFNSALLTTVQYMAENTAIAKGNDDLLPRHVLRL